MTSIDQWRRAAHESTERSRARRQQISPHPWPQRVREWAIAFGIALSIVVVGWLTLVFFGAAAWS